MPTLLADAKRLADALRQLDVKVVLAESCTGGLVAASLAKVPGISNYLCGSAVTYRNDTKHEWLGVSNDKLTRPGPVSAIIAREMATGVLTKTPEADWSASITGHLGPGAPKRLDGLVYVGIANREANEHTLAILHVSTSRRVLGTKTRGQRQQEAASFVLQQLFEALNSLAH